MEFNGGDQQRAYRRGRTCAGDASTVVSAGYAACAMQLDGGGVNAREVRQYFTGNFSPREADATRPETIVRKKEKPNPRTVPAGRPSRDHRGSGALNSLSSNVRVRLMRSHGRLLTDLRRPSVPTPRRRSRRGRPRKKERKEEKKKILLQSDQSLR